jgi:hypothetical protein
MAVRVEPWLRGSLCAMAALVMVQTMPAGSARPHDPTHPAVQTLPAVPPQLEAIRQMPAGMVVAVDPATGELRAPTEDERDALTSASAATRAFAAPQAVELAGGGQLLLASAAHVDFLTAVLGADGSLTMRCRHGFDAGTPAFDASHAALTRGGESRHDR